MQNYVYVSDVPIDNIVDFFDDNLCCNQIEKSFADDDSALKFASEMRKNGFDVVIALTQRKDN